MSRYYVHTSGLYQRFTHPVSTVISRYITLHSLQFLYFANGLYYLIDINFVLCYQLCTLYWESLTQDLLHTFGRP